MQLSTVPAMAFCAIGFGSASALAQVSTTAGAVTTPYPTTQGISIEWAITGDSDNDGVVTVRYREAGASTWKTGMNLFRIPAGSNTTGIVFGTGGGRWGNKHSGSLFDLTPGTSYEIELTLQDADGGSTTRTTTVSTRPIPVAPANANVKQVTPATFDDTLAAVQPGDLLLLGAGTYSGFTVRSSGTSTLPIVLRGQSVDSVIIDGGVTMDDQQYIYLENVTINDEVRLNGASNMVVRGCKIRTTGGGITSEMGDNIPRNNYIVDNDIVGAATWADSELGAGGFDGGEGIRFTGSGHVVCFNHIKGFRDDISLLEEDSAYDQVSIDICNNDVEVGTDDAIEADAAMGNVRVVRNRIKNCFAGLSSQPGLGGPLYFLRNVMYNVLYTSFKLHNETVGDVAMHNTVVKCGDAFRSAGEPYSHEVFRNNLFIGGIGGGTYGGYGNGDGDVLALNTDCATCSFDYDGLGSVGTNTFAGYIGSTDFTSLQSLQANTTEVHAVQVDMSVFAASVPFPSNPFPAKTDADFRLAPGGAAVDRGVVWAGLNEGFTGTAPDLGAYELDQAVPIYGPRPAGTGGVSGTGGSSASGGVTGTASSASSGGVTAIGGATGSLATAGSGGGGGPTTGGVTAIGGATHTGGSLAAAGSGGGGVPAGGMTAMGGATHTGGSLAKAVGGASANGETGQGGAAAGRSSTTAGLNLSGGSSTRAVQTQADAAPDTNPDVQVKLAGSAGASEDSSCGCSTVGNRRGGGLTLLALLAMVRRRRDGKRKCHL